METLSDLEQSCYEYLSGLGVELWGDYFIADEGKREKAAQWLAKQIEAVTSIEFQKLKERVQGVRERMEEQYKRGMMGTGIEATIARAVSTPDTMHRMETLGVDSEEEVSGVLMEPSAEMKDVEVEDEG